MQTKIRNEEILSRRIRVNARRRMKRSRGVTLIEVVISSLLVALLVVSSMKSVSAVFLTWQVTEDQFDADMLAQDMMSEVLQSRYEEPTDTPKFGTEGTEANNSRIEWDDTDDYDGWKSSPPQLKDDTPMSSYADWTRAVDVEKINPVSPSTVLGNGSLDTGLRRIIVTVTDPNGKEVILICFRSQYGAVEQAPAVETTFVTNVRVDLQVGGSLALSTGTNLVNHAKDQ